MSSEQQRQLQLLLGRARLLVKPSFGKEAGIETCFKFLQLHTLDLLILFTACNLPNSFHYAAIYKFRFFFFLTMARYETRATLGHFACLFPKANVTPEFLNFEILIPYYKPVNAPYTLVLYGNYCTRGQVSKFHIALGCASCYMNFSTYPLVQ